MARNFRIIVPKKRGNRTTGSKVWGKAVEAGLSAAALAAGCIALVFVLAHVVIPEWRVHHQFVEHTCVVLETRQAKLEGDGAQCRPEVRIRYSVDGESHVVWAYSIGGRYTDTPAAVQEILRAFEPGREYPCWYDPADPSVVVLVRMHSWWSWLTLAIPISFILMGVAGLVYTGMTWGKSAERQAALAKRAAQMGLFEADRPDVTAPPNIPRPAGVTDSPGTTLAYRLPVVAASGWKLLGGVVACLGWNGIVAIFAGWAIGGILEGRPDWMLTALVIPFVIVGGGIIVYFLRYALVVTAVGPTLVEISEQPLYPGRRYELFVSQTGRLTMKSLDVVLACEEQATYHQGTNTRREGLRVFEQPVYRHEQFVVRHGVPFEAHCLMDVPAGAMHSFKSDHNEIGWKIVVTGDVAGWPGFSRSFPVIVHPAPARTNGRLPR